MDDIYLGSGFEEGEKIVPEVWSGDGQIRTNDQMMQWAEDSGCVFEEADNTTLFIDVDTPEQMGAFKAGIILADSLFGIDKRLKTHTITPSKSGPPHFHIRVKIPPGFSQIERILLQACLGSDLLREMISMKRSREGEENVIVFFEKKEAVSGNPL